MQGILQLTPRLAQQHTPPHQVRPAVVLHDCCHHLPLGVFSVNEAGAVNCEDEQWLQARMQLLQQDAHTPLGGTAG
jgi:hypothetical protein